MQMDFSPLPFILEQISYSGQTLCTFLMTPYEFSNTDIFLNDVRIIYKHHTSFSINEVSGYFLNMPVFLCSHNICMKIRMPNTDTLLSYIPQVMLRCYQLS